MPMLCDAFCRTNLDANDLHTISSTSMEKIDWRRGYAWKAGKLYAFEAKQIVVMRMWPDCWLGGGPVKNLGPPRAGMLTIFFAVLPLKSVSWSAICCFENSLVALSSNEIVTTFLNSMRLRCWQHLPQFLSANAASQRDSKTDVGMCLP